MSTPAVDPGALAPSPPPAPPVPEFADRAREGNGRFADLAGLGLVVKRYERGGQPAGPSQEGEVMR